MHTHLLINLVTREEGIPEGVLIRAVEPEDGIETMKINRNKSGFELTNGPGKWTKAFNIPRAIDGSTINQCRLSNTILLCFKSLISLASNIVIIDFIWSINDSTYSMVLVIPACST